MKYFIWGSEFKGRNFDDEYWTKLIIVYMILDSLMIDNQMKFSLKKSHTRDLKVSSYPLKDEWGILGYFNILKSIFSFCRITRNQHFSNHLSLNFTVFENTFETRAYFYKSSFVGVSVRNLILYEIRWIFSYFFFKQEIKHE